MSARTRFLAAMDMARVTSTRLAELLGVKQPTISAYVKEMAERDLSKWSRLDEACALIGVDSWWVRSGENPPPWFLGAAPPRAETAQGPAVLELVGEVSAASGDNWSDLEKYDHIHELGLKENLSLYRVRGNSAYPVVFPGQFVLVDMDENNHPKDKDLVVCFDPINESAIIKRYVQHPAAPGGFALTSIDIGKDVYFASDLPADDLLIRPVVGILFPEAFTNGQ